MKKTECILRLWILTYKVIIDNYEIRQNHT